MFQIIKQIAVTPCQALQNDKALCCLASAGYSVSHLRVKLHGVILPIFVHKACDYFCSLYEER